MTVGWAYRLTYLSTAHLQSSYLAWLGEREGTGDARARQNAGTASHSCTSLELGAVGDGARVEQSGRRSWRVVASSFKQLNLVVLLALGMGRIAALCESESQTKLVCL